MNTPKPSNRPSHIIAEQYLERPHAPVIQDVTPPQWTPRRASVVNPPVGVQEQAITAPSAVPQTPLQRRFKTPNAKTWIRWMKKYGLAIATLLAVIVLVRLSASPGTGGLVIAAYAIGVFMLRIPSRVTFWLAALALVGVGIELLLLPEAGRANSGALLVFLLLGVGLVSSVFETRRLESKNKLSRRR